MLKSVAVLTSGGDAPGMNAAIRAVVRAGLSQGLDVYGVRRGYEGLVHGEIIPMKSREVADIIHRGGTILKTARSERFKTVDGRRQAIRELERHGIEGLAVIGGDGSFQGALELAKMGFPTVGIPATIDNDIPCTDHSIGFDTAVSTAVDAINKIRDTASSHERTYVVEVMGRYAGHIAIQAGLAGGAEWILIPEVRTSLDVVCERIRAAHDNLGKSHSIVVVAEGFGGDLANQQTPESAGFRVGDYIGKNTGLETRVTVLGHIQRGGIPSVRDRILASRFGERALTVLNEGGSGKMVGERYREIRVYDIDHALMQEKEFDFEGYELANLLSSV